ncbi:MAG: phosphatase PAP2 family protein [Fibrella sp.]|nr:phosphatase PAP2 family protein [Armatimonadota bacterium]
MIVGVVRPLLRGRQGAGESLRTADALITSVALTEGLKRLTREKRPDGSGSVDSFPSGHTTAAFAVAAMEAHYHPKEALYWYGGAVLIAESRVGLHRHYVHDVVAGAAVGYLTAQWAIKSPRGLVLSPVIRPETGERGFALAISY